ncbi:MAG: sugar ABC transporter ATP-binding protein [Pseudomonadota bacterium]
MTLLATRGLTKQFGGVTVLDGVDFSAAAGEIHAIVGANGAGKSTFIKIVSGALAPSAGSLWLDGAAARFASPREAQQAGISTVYQELTLVPQLSVAENICLAHEPTGRFGLVDGAAMRQRAADALTRFGVTIDVGRATSSLSVAEQQLVEIARALSRRGRVLILDEPTAVLSLPEQDKLFAALRRLRAEGLAVLYISHRLAEIFSLCDRVSVFREGRLVSAGRTADLCEQDIVTAMIGRPAPAAGAARVRDFASAPLALAAMFGSPDRRSRLEVRAGEVVGLAGFVGAGRTELAHALIGCGDGRSVELRLGGVRVAPRSPAEAARHGLVYVTEDRKRDGLFGARDVLANTTAASLSDVSRVGMMDFVRERRIGRDILLRLKLKSPSLGAAVTTLSGGNQQKVVFARALLQRPKVLICDEPTRGVDVGAKEEIYGLISRLAVDGVGIVVISSEFSELLRLCDRILVMREHAMVAGYARGEVDETALLQASAGLRPAPRSRAIPID